MQAWSLLARPRDDSSDLQPGGRRQQLIAENADAQTPPLMATPSEPLRVVEFFAGIGGLHYALQRSGVPHRVVQAFDVDDSAVRPHGKSERGVSSASVSRRRL